MFSYGSVAVTINPSGERKGKYLSDSIGSIDKIRSAFPIGIRSEKISFDEIRRCDSTAPPLWLMPCTSACFRLSPKFIAARSIIDAMIRIPCPPTPEINIFFCIFKLINFLPSLKSVHIHVEILSPTPHHTQTPLSLLQHSLRDSFLVV